MPPKYKYFSPEEIKGLDGELCAMLDRARGLAGIPFRITSGYRTYDKNTGLPEAVQDSSHLTGNAVDLACSDSLTRFRMLKALFDVGFVRIGVYGNHIHCDNSIKLPQRVLWYSSGT